MQYVFILRDEVRYYLIYIFKHLIRKISMVWKLQTTSWLPNIQIECIKRGVCG